jgi:DNA-binding beta-propeller fold protein YncE
MAALVSQTFAGLGVLYGQTQARAASAADAQARRPIVIRRAPVRTIQDPHSSFSAVAIDHQHDEIVLQDESLEQIMVYDRLTNTPPTAAMSEPKRLIGGSLTNIELNCGIYIDPNNGDIYNVNGDVNNHMSVFSRNAKGNTKADRTLNTPHRTFAVVVDEEAQELFLTLNHAPAVVVYRKQAEGNEVPLRILEGDKTRLMDVQGITLDTKNQVMYVANRGAWARNKNNMGWSRALKEGASTWDIPEQIDAWKNFIPGSGEIHPPSINVYPLKAKGDAPPLRVIQGDKTQLNWPAHIALDVERQELYVTNAWTDEILIFGANQSGDVAPLRVLKGPKTQLSKPHGVYVDEQNNEIVVANFGNHAATVYPRGAGGDIAPKRMIRAAPLGTPAAMLGNVAALDYDTKRNQILAPNCVAFPRIAAFDRLAKGGDGAARIIAGQKSLLNRAMHDVWYNPVHDEISIANPFAQAVMTYRGGADGEEAPVRMIMGPKTQMAHPDYAVVVDPVHNEIYVGEKEYILVFPRLANGDVAPLRVIRGSDTRLVNLRGMVVDPIRNVLVVATNSGIMLFDRTANGNVKPKASIEGPNSMLPTTGNATIQNLRYIQEKGYIVGALRNPRNLGGDEDEGESETVVANRSERPGGAIAVWSINDKGDVPPLFVLTNPAGNIGGMRVALNPNHKEIMVGGGLNVKTYSFPEIF